MAQKTVPTISASVVWVFEEKLFILCPRLFLVGIRGFKGTVGQCPEISLHAESETVTILYFESSSRLGQNNLAMITLLY